MARAPRGEVTDERTPEQLEAVRQRFSGNPFRVLSDLTPEERIHAERVRRAYQAAAQGDWGPGIALGLFSADAGSR